MSKHLTPAERKARQRYREKHGLALLTLELPEDVMEILGSDPKAAAERYLRQVAAWLRNPYNC